MRTGDVTMQFLMMVKSSENQGPLPKAVMDALSKVREEDLKPGQMIATGALYPMAASAHIRVSQGQLNVIDGPFTETREVVGGYAIMEFATREEAIQSAREFMDLYRRHWPGWEGETEVRQIFGANDFTVEGSKIHLKPETSPNK
jgi:hypothetical protein